ncbi:MAG: 23S rRNA (uracil(1939)-C(5))-methyltransferase RlmD [Flavobacterium sp.]
MSRKRKENIILSKILVIDAGSKGVCVGKAEDGKIVLIPNVVPGDVVDVKVFKKKSKYYEGIAIHFHEKSANRIPPICSHFGYCGGCKWQNMQYEAQLKYKQNEVWNHLKRIGKITLPEITPIVGSKDIFYYRNKMEFSFSDTKWLTPEQIASEEVIDREHALGFHIPKMWDKILDIDHCYLQPDPSNAIRNGLKAFCIQNQIPFYSPRQQTGLMRSLMIRTSSIGEIMVLVQFYAPMEKEIAMVMGYLEQNFPEITSLQFVINQKANDTIYDQEVVCFAGKNFIEEEMEGLKFKIQAKSFYQTNSKQAYELYQITRDFAQLSGKEVVFDLYTGTGTIALFVSKLAKKVVGVEAVADAIKDAEENAKNNQISNCHFEVGDMKNVFNDEFFARHGKPDVVITDPPRDGMHADVVAQLLKIEAPKIVYVSCNSATQARDLALLDEKYEVQKIQPVDMFPQTYHVENVVLLTQKNA